MTVENVVSLLASLGAAAFIGSFGPPGADPYLRFIAIALAAIAWLLAQASASKIHRVSQENYRKRVMIGSAVLAVLFILLAPAYYLTWNDYTVPYATPNGQQRRWCGPTNIECLTVAGQTYFKRLPTPSKEDAVRDATGKSHKVWKYECIKARMRILWPFFLLLLFSEVFLIVFATKASTRIP
jgi:hypothetical protein